MCDNSPDTPFCSPQSGTRVQTGETLEITWNPLFFSPSSDQPADEIFIQADFLLPNSGRPQLAGFTSTALDPGAGAFRWPVLDTYVPGNSTSATAVLSITAPLPTTSTNGSFVRIGTGRMRFPGPSVEILRAVAPTTTGSNLVPSTPSQQQGNISPQTQQPQPQQQQQQSSPNPLAIALPIALGLLTAVAMITYLLLKRHRPEVLSRLSPRRLLLGGGLAGIARGYGERQSRAQRVRRVRGKAVEIKVVKTDVEGLRANAARMVGTPGFGSGSASGGGGWGMGGYPGGRV